MNSFYTMLSSIFDNMDYPRAIEKALEFGIVVFIVSFLWSVTH